VNIITRQEVKYVIGQKTYEDLLHDLKPYLEECSYSNQQIFNVYYDNDNDDLAIRSTEKKEFKDKLRARVYVTNEKMSDVFIELKKKLKGTSYKRRVKIPYDKFNFENLEFLDESQIGKEIKFLLEKTGCKPKVCISYSRMSYNAIGEEDLRITFDSNIKTRTTNLGFMKNEDDQTLINQGEYVMEIKSGQGSFPLWLVKILSRHKVFPDSMSKYGKAFALNT